MTNITPKKAATRTGKWKKIFIEHLRKNGVVGYACNAANVSRNNAYAHRKKDEKFAAQWDEALEYSCDLLEKEAVRRARIGVDEPVFYQGSECGTIRKYSDTLLIFLLKANRPEKYREKFVIEHHAKDIARKAKEFGITEEQIESSPVLSAIFARFGLVGNSIAGNGEAGETEHRR